MPEANPQPILTYSLSFFILEMLLKLIGIIELSTLEILAYAAVFFGVSSVYTSMGHNKKLTLFLGTVVFLFGIIFFLLVNFDIYNISSMIFPSAVLILGISSFMLFLDNTSDKAILFISLIFILLGIVYAVSVGSLRPYSFFFSAYKIAVKYWMVVLIALIIVIVINRLNRK